MSPTQIADNIISFASEIDYNTIDQAKETAQMPFIWPHIALMPDAHSGKGSAVGNKDIDQVMVDATELVDVVTTLTQKVNIKGT